MESNAYIEDDSPTYTRHTHDWCALVGICDQRKQKISRFPPFPPFQYLYRVRFRSNTWYSSYLITVPKYFHEIDQSGLNLSSHRFGGLLLGEWLVCKYLSFCPKNLIRWGSWQGKRYWSYYHLISCHLTKNNSRYGETITLASPLSPVAY
jgi:hypothetical protein